MKDDIDLSLSLEEEAILLDCFGSEYLAKVRARCKEVQIEAQDICDQAEVDFFLRDC